MRSGTDVDRLRNRRNVMDDTINPFEYRDVDCSGRSLATLLIAWVGAAMVASVLLRWKYMWIALMILTLLFLFACGYAACNARRVQERVVASEEARIFARQRRDRNIQSVSGAVDDYSEITDPPAYQAYWITDLPPPYAMVIGAGALSLPPLSPPVPLTTESETTSRASITSNPPPYSVAISSDVTITSQTAIPTLRSNRIETTSSNRLRTNINDEATNSRIEEIIGSTEASTWNDDTKMATEQTRNDVHDRTNNSSMVLATETQYISSIISCTFGRGQRQDNAERNGSSCTVMTTSTTRDRPDFLQLNHHDSRLSMSQTNGSTS